MHCAIFVIATPWLNFLRSYCGDFYGSVLWELVHPSVEDVCITWRKGLKRDWELPTRLLSEQGVLYQRMHSLIGRNAQHSATLLGTPYS